MEKYSDHGNQETLFKQRGSADYYKMDYLAPEFIGMSNGNTGLQSYVSAMPSPQKSSKKRVSSQLERSSLSMRSSIEYDAPLTATGLNILDSVPKMDDINKIVLKD